MATFLYSVTVHKAETYTETGTEGRRETNRDTERATFLRGHRSFHSQRIEPNFRIFIRSSSHFCVSLLHTPSSSATNLWRCPPLNGQVFDSLMELRFPLSSSIHPFIHPIPPSLQVLRQLLQRQAEMLISRIRIASIQHLLGCGFRYCRRRRKDETAPVISTEIQSG